MVGSAATQAFRPPQGENLRNEFEVLSRPARLLCALPIRNVRNDAAHRTIIASVTPDAVLASLLISPKLARLADNL